MQLTAQLGRRLDELHLVALFLDGIHVAELRGGRVTPGPGHDDRANSLCLAICMAMQAAIKPRSLFDLSSTITTSRVPWGRRAGADQDRGEHIVRTPTGEVEVYRDLTESPGRNCSI
jgi:hypothetical protein